FIIAPALPVITAFLALAVIPFGDTVRVAGHDIPLQITDVNIAVLWILGTTSMGVYGIVLGGWASNSKYPLLGGLRSSAQMISYELAQGISLVSVIVMTGTLSLASIVRQQEHLWFIVPQFFAFVIYREHDGRLGRRDHGLPRRLERSVPARPRLVPDQAERLPLLLRLAPRHLPAPPLRPADGLRVEGALAGLASEPHRHGHRAGVPAPMTTLFEPFLFAMFGGIAIGCALGVVFHRNPVHCALLLVGVLLSVSGLFVMLHAPFIAALQVIVYAGAIMVLFLFVVMLLNVKGEAPLLTPGAWKGFGFFFALIVFVELLYIVLSQGGTEGTPAAAVPLPPGFGSRSS
ncbi:MAG: hypothetical protein E6K75_10220, partial [Candidatus Eisenbacteria bacterium]